MAARVIAFYSFKGGVGRTVTLANTGIALAQRGFRVLLADGDLEAPGLTSLSQLRPAATNRGLLHALDQFLAAYERRAYRVAQLDGAAPDAIPVPADELPDLEALARSVELRPPEHMPPEPVAITVLGAGTLDPGYGERLLHMSRTGFRGRRTSSEPLDGLRLALGALDVDFVLLDTRTGYSDLGDVGLCDLADEVVLVTTLCPQSADNIAKVAKLLADRARATQDGRPKRVLLVESMVPETASTDDDVVGLSQALRERSGLMPAATVPFVPRLLLGDPLYALDPSQRTTEAVQSLAAQLCGPEIDALAAASSRALADDGGADEAALAPLLALTRAERARAEEVVLRAFLDLSLDDLAWIGPLVRRVPYLAFSHVPGLDLALEAAPLLALAKSGMGALVARVRGGLPPVEREAEPGSLLEPYTRFLGLLDGLLGVTSSRLFSSNLTGSTPWVRSHVLRAHLVLQAIVHATLQGTAGHALALGLSFAALTGPVWREFVAKVQEWAWLSGTAGKLVMANAGALGGGEASLDGLPASLLDDVGRDVLARALGGAGAT